MPASAEPFEPRTAAPLADAEVDVQLPGFVRDADDLKKPNPAVEAGTAAEVVLDAVAASLATLVAGSDRGNTSSPQIMAFSAIGLALRARFRCSTRLVNAARRAWSLLSTDETRLCFSVRLIRYSSSTKQPK